MTEKKLCKSSKHRMICGVCGGFADFFKIDPTIVRLIFLVIFFLKGAGLLAYVICALVMPSDFVENEDENASKSDRNTEKSSSKSKKTNAKRAPHTDEEFDSYFTNK